MTRPTRDQYFLRLARLAATRGTCARRRVGAVAVDARGYLLATGYNGPPAGLPHCEGEHRCPGADAPSGQRLGDCRAVHAEVNLLAQCPDVWRIDTVYLTVSPCYDCAKALVTSGCRRLVFLEEYPAPAARELWLSAGRAWELGDSGDAGFDLTRAPVRIPLLIWTDDVSDGVIPGYVDENGEWYDQAEMVSGAPVAWALVPERPR